jgi:UEV domain
VLLLLPQMLLHRHVDSSGLVYLPYLHEWSDRTHNLVQLCTALSGVFSQDPPVYARQSREPQPIHQQRHAYATAHGAQQPHAASPQQQQQSQQAQQWGSGSGTAAAAAAAAGGGGGSSGVGYRDDPVAEAKRALTAKLQSALQVRVCACCSHFIECQCHKLHHCL